MHLLKRNKIYYFKLVIPRDIKHFIPIKVIKVSLRTNKRIDAIHLSAQYTSKYYNLFLQLRNPLLSDKDKLSIANKYFAEEKGKNTISTLSELSCIYANDKVSTNTWTDKTYKAYQFIFTIFTKVIDTNKEASAITRADIQKFKSILTTLPKTTAKYLHMDIAYLLQLSEPSISVTTAQKYLSYILSFFKWLETEGHVDKSVATGINMKVDQSAAKRKIPYAIEDLHKLFNTDIFTTSLSSCLIDHPERIYIPILAMYQGMRINEIAQLYTSDISLVDDVYCLYINAETADKRLKNKSSQRIIPIHRRVIELGFIDHVNNQKLHKQKRVWSNLSLGGDGYCTNFRKWYGQFNRKYITSDTRKTFHCFRHLFADTLNKLALKGGIDHNAIKYLLGHSTANDITLDVYTHGYNMHQLSEVLNTLNYPDVDIGLHEQLASPS